MISTIDYITNRIGKPYEVNGRGPETYDCFGLILDYYREVKGIDLDIEFGKLNPDWYKDYSYNEYKARLLAEHTIKIDSPRRDCIVLCNMDSTQDLIDHVGIYVGTNQVLNTNTSKGVHVMRLSTLTRTKRLKGYGIIDAR